MRKRILLYLVLPFSVAFVVFTLIVAMYVSNLLNQYQVETGNWLLIYSIGAGMFLCLLKVAALSLRVTKPLDKMKTAALGIKGGDYTAQTGVNQSDEIGELASILDDMARKLGEASEAKEASEKRRQDFMANISHELRTPITVLRGSLEALRDGVVAEPALVKEYYAQMHTESLYLERLVTDLFDLARLQSTEFSVDMEDVDMMNVIKDAVRTMTPIAAEKGVSLPCPEANDDAHDANSRSDSSIYIPPVMGDYGRLKQLFIALLDNAIKFTPRGKNVATRLREDGGRVCVTIQDEGGGISGEDLPRIFERFYRSTSPDNRTGTGLGLPIAKQIADRHGAEVKVASELGRGTTVEVVF
ncbi:MAG: HAMP domain-containing histidine kinase [Defluviitaleaceae bacterium]|nr:HAMP domain-containing histidine kinase [Defluviitaleaceae bacterium]MCL2239091.1 HAMP domain-containing histidine kinase [Defluviitaleaceae bacterium]